MNEKIRINSWAHRVGLPVVLVYGVWYVLVQDGDGSNPDAMVWEALEEGLEED